MKHCIVLRFFGAPCQVTPAPAPINLARQLSAGTHDGNESLFQKTKDWMNEQELANESNFQGYFGCGSDSLLYICRGIFSGGAQLGAQHGLLRRCAGDVSEYRISMYSGPHVPGRLGAAQRSCIVETSQRKSHSHTDAYCHTDADSQTNPHTHSASGWRELRRAMEQHAGLHRRHGSQRGRQQLHRSFLDAKPESHHSRQQRSGRQWRSVEPSCSMQHRTNPHSHADT